MLALTIWQPWATLIAIGAKPYEFRRWRVPPGIVGRRIAIHAGKRPVRRAEIQHLLLALNSGDPTAWGTSLVRDLARPLLEHAMSSPGALPLASILCTAVIGAAVPAAEIPNAGDSDRVNHEIYGWPLTAIEVLEPLVPIGGAQGFWHWQGTPADV